MIQVYMHWVGQSRREQRRTSLSKKTYSLLTDAVTSQNLGLAVTLFCRLESIVYNGQTTKSSIPTSNTRT
jgi:hypothetical protein